MNRVGWPLRVVQALALLVIVGGPPALIVTGVIGLRHTQQIDTSGVSAEATVLDNGVHCNYADVTYATSAGTPERGTVDTDGCLPVGSLTQVRYDPLAPNVVRLAVKAGNPADEAWGGIIMGAVLMVLEATLVVAILRRRALGLEIDTSHRHLWRRTRHGIVVASVLLGLSVVSTVYLLFGDRLGLLGVLPAVLSVVCVGYLCVPRSGSVRLKVWAWFPCVVLAALLPYLLTDVWIAVVGQPQGAVVTLARTVCVGSSPCHDTREYAVQLDDGRQLSFGDLTQDDIGRHNQGDRIELRSDPTGFVAPRPDPRSLDVTGPVVALVVALLVLVGFAMWPVFGGPLLQRFGGRPARTARR